MMHKTHAFTLIELLVVVTIIVVLLALLTPALDKAIYSADLAVCGSKLRVIATGVVTYAHAQKKWYPDRLSRTGNGSNRPIDMYWGANSATSKKDDRIVLRTFLNLNATLNCPLVKPIDIEGSALNSNLTSTYNLYFGFQYVVSGRPPERGLFRLGDRMTYTDAGDGSAPPIVNSFKVLASDRDVLNVTAGITNASHPDLNGDSSPSYAQDSDFGAPPKKSTGSAWRAVNRSPIDTNYVFDDGSVKRFDRVTWDEGVPATRDDRLVRVPETDIANSTFELRIPER